MSPKHPPRSLRGHAWFLTVLNDVFHDRNAVCMSPESSVSILKFLAFLEVPHLLGVSRASSKESKRTFLVPDWSLVNDVFRAINLIEMHRRNFIPVLKSLATLEVSRVLGVSRASSKESKRTFLVPDWSQ